MYEPWVLKIDLSSTAGDATDPDFPNAGKLTKYSTKPARTGIAMVTVIQSKEICIREFWADYLKDRSLTGAQLITFTFWPDLFIRSQHAPSQNGVAIDILAQVFIFGSTFGAVFYIKIV